jgi:hypothetical protein
VRFKADGNILVDSAPVVNGEARHTITTLDIGSHSITAEYVPNPGFNSSAGTLAAGQTVTNPFLMLPLLNK